MMNTFNKEQEETSFSSVRSFLPAVGLSVDSDLYISKHELDITNTYE